MAEALYRKYRPQVFGDVVGQDHIERTIKNAIDAEAVSHAYLFCGPRGTGKTTTARLLAKALLCEHGPTSEPDGTCQQCLEIADGTHPDVYELDAASRTGVENVRDEIIGRVNFAPTRGSYKVYIIDEVHMLSTAAFNALLKTLEEPPSHVVFILCTTDPQKVPETIHSRCQRFDFHRLSNDEIVTRLGAICVAEGVEFEGDALELIAHRAEGGMRNALTSLEQLIAFGEGHVTVAGAEDLLGSLGTTDLAEIFNAIGKRDVASCFTWTAGYVESGADLAQFARDMAEHARNLYVMSLAGTDAAVDIPEAERAQLAEELALFGPDRLARLLGVLGDLISDLRTATNPRLAFEIALTRMVRPDSDLTIEALAERIEALESGYSAVTTVVSAAPPTGQVAAGAPGALGQAAGLAQSAAGAPGQAAGLAQPAAGTSAARADAPVRSGSSLHSEEIAAQSFREGVSKPSEGAPGTPSATGGQAAAAATAGAPYEMGGQAAAAPAYGASSAAAVQAGALASSGFSNTGVEAAGQVDPLAADGGPSEPVAGASVGASGDLGGLLANPAALQRAWLSVTNTVKKERQSFAAMLVGVKARPSDDGTAVAIEFPASNPISLSMARKPDMQDLLTQAFQAATGFPVPFQLVSAGEAVAPAVAQPAAGAPGQTAGLAQPVAGAPGASGLAQPVAGAPGQAAGAPSAQTVAADPFGASSAAGGQTSATDAPVAPSAPVAPAPNALAPDYDQVPVDLYDGVPFVPDAPAPDASVAPGSAMPSFAHPVESVPAAPAESVPAMAEQSAFPPEPPLPSPDAVSAATMPAEMGVDELTKIASETFGGSIVFEEVDE